MKNKKPYWEMTTEELAEATKEFDREFSVGRFAVEPPPEAVAQQKRAKKKIGRPPIGAGAQNVMVSVERNLLSEIDQYAESHDLSRSQAIACGMRLVIQMSKATTHPAGRASKRSPRRGTPKKPTKR